MRSCTTRRPDAYEKLVDRLLASPHYGERMALLLARPRALRRHRRLPRRQRRSRCAPYRDYVIEAFNDNMPFDRFTIEQLAGDLLPDADDGAADRLGLQPAAARRRRRAARSAKEYRAKYVADRVRNASTSGWARRWAAPSATTTSSTRSPQDFYRFAAFFADVKEAPVGRRKPDPLPDPAQKPALDALDAGSGAEGRARGAHAHA